MYSSRFETVDEVWGTLIPNQLTMYVACQVWLAAFSHFVDFHSFVQFNVVGEHKTIEGFLLHLIAKVRALLVAIR